MRRLHLLVEGQTEELLARQVFVPHWEGQGWVASVSILTTKRPASGGWFRGGVRSWEKIRREVTLLLGSQFDAVTTMIDYYGFPPESPGMADRPSGSPGERVHHVERTLAAAVADSRFVPHLTLHETEAWVFAAVDELGDLIDEPQAADQLRKIAIDAGGPELVNDHPDTAPSKRLQERLPAYRKTLHGPLCVESLGLTNLRTRCPHLDEWLAGLERLAG